MNNNWKFALIILQFLVSLMIIPTSILFYLLSGGGIAAGPKSDPSTIYLLPLLLPMFAGYVLIDAVRMQKNTPSKSAVVLVIIGVVLIYAGVLTGSILFF